MEPKIGPMQGVHPKPKAIPITNENKMLPDFFVSNLLSKFKKLIFKIPISCNENTIITIPADNLSIWEFCKRNCPKKDTVAPKSMKTVEKPKQNKTKGKKFIFFLVIHLKIDLK